MDVNSGLACHQGEGELSGTANFSKVSQSCRKNANKCRGSITGAERSVEKFPKVAVGQFTGAYYLIRFLCTFITRVLLKVHKDVQRGSSIKKFKPNLILKTGL